MWAKRWFASTQHLYEGEWADAVPGGEGELQVEEGSETDRSDLEALTPRRRLPSAGGHSAWERSPTWTR